MDTLAEISHVTLRARSGRRHTWHLQEHFASIASRIASDTRQELPPHHSKHDVINCLEAKIKGFELMASRPSSYLQIAGPP